MLEQVPGLCGCGHDAAYHYRPIFQQAQDGSMVMTYQDGCRNCACPKYDEKRTKGYSGFAENAPKEWNKS